MSDRTFQLEDVARSCHSLFRDVSGGVAGPDWDGLSVEAQQRWFNAAKQAPDVLAANDGRQLSGVAYEVYRTFLPGEERAAAFVHWAAESAAFKLGWEAVTRHLWALHDGDDVGDLGSAEAHWREWAARQPARQELERRQKGTP